MTKKEAILYHKIMVLHNLMMETLDDLKVNDEFKIEHKKIFEPALDYVESFLENTTVLDKNLLKRTQYIYDLSKKLDTIIRQNYEPL